MYSKPFDSKPASITQQAVAQNFSKNEKYRRELAVKNKNVYYGNLADYLNRFNQEQKMTIVNLVKPIVSKRASMLYGAPLVRELEGPSVSVAALEQVYADNDYDAFLGQVDLLAELTGSVLVSPVPNEELQGGIKLIPYDGSMLSALPSEEDPTEPVALSLLKTIYRLVSTYESNNPQMESLLREEIWTDDSITVRISRQGDNPAVTEETIPNELGYMPFTIFKGEDVPNKYLGTSPTTNLAELNIAYNQLLTDLNYTVKMQAAGIIVLEGYQSGESLRLSPGRAITLPIGASASSLDLSPKISEALDVISYIESKHYDTSSVPEVSVVGSEGVSGRELIVRWFPLIQVFREKAKRYNKYEFQLANNILRRIGLPPITNLSVDFSDEKNLPLSAADETLERDLALGLTTPEKELMSRDATLTPEGASEKVEENIMTNKAHYEKEVKEEETEEVVEEEEEKEEE